MEIYLKNKNGLLKETTLGELLIKELETKFELDLGNFAGENYNWIGVIKESKNSSKVTVNLIFEDDGNTLKDIRVFEVPLITVEDDDNSKQIL